MTKLHRRAWGLGNGMVRTSCGRNVKKARIADLASEVTCGTCQSQGGHQIALHREKFPNRTISETSNVIVIGANRQLRGWRWLVKEIDGHGVYLAKSLRYYDDFEECQKAYFDLIHELS